MFVISSIQDANTGKLTTFIDTLNGKDKTRYSQERMEPAKRAREHVTTCMYTHTVNKRQNSDLADGSIFIVYATISELAVVVSRAQSCTYNYITFISEDERGVERKSRENEHGRASCI